MRTRKTPMLAFVVSCLVAAPAFAQPDAPPALQSAGGSSAAGTATLDAPAPVPDFGTGSYEVLSVTAYAFQPSRQTGRVTGVNENGNMYTWATAGSSPYFVADITVPAGAQIDWIGLDYCDNNASASFTLEAFDSFGDNSFNTVGSLTPPDRTGCGYAYNGTAFGYVTTANSGRILTLYVFQNGALDGSISFRGAEVWFKRRVSPAPATATFADVPTSSSQFRFVEALAAAGITGGCGGGNFCPDAAVTRGQMAVFLSTALGLHFPD